MDYKSSKEAFVSGATGSTITHVNLISAVAVCSIALNAAIRSRFSPSDSSTFLLEWTVLVLPLLLSMTLFAETPLLLCLLLIVPTVLIFMRPLREDDEPPLSPISISRVPSQSHQISDTSSASPLRTSIIPLPSLTIYRSHMLLMTFLAILAVDFPVFPRSLAKCETFGVSLMDLGVGSFVFSQGVVSAIPILKDPSYLLAPAMPKIISVCKKVLPVFFLGVIRVLSVKGTEYPEHESEYGTHWNFFFTLAFLPILQVILHPVIIHLPISLLGFLVVLSHQLALSFTSLQHYALHAPRTSLVSSNREGLVSLTGYAAIHLLGLSLGTLLLPPSPSDFRRQQYVLRQRLRGVPPTTSSSSSPSSSRTTTKGDRQLQRQDGKTSIELFAYAVLWWGCLGLCYVVGIGGGVSRRLANLPYVIWVAAYNTSFIMFYLLIDKLAPSKSPSYTASVSPFPFSTNGGGGLHPGSSSALHAYPPNPQPRTASKEKAKAPALLEAINLNGLALFLLANVATGLINLSMATMYASDAAAMVVLAAYSCVICLVAWACRGRRVWRL